MIPEARLQEIEDLARDARFVHPELREAVPVLVAEVRRQREALERIAEENTCSITNPVASKHNAPCAYHTARAALTEESEETK